ENDEMIDKIKDYINACYLSAMEAVWHIFKYKITSQLPSVTCLPVHLPEQEGCQQCIVKPYKPNHTHVTRMNIIRLCVSEKYYLHMLLSCCVARLFRELCIVNGTLYSNFQDAAHAFGLLKDINKNEQCFAKAVTYKCTSAQLRLLFCHLILEGMMTQSVWQIHHELLSANYINKKDDIQQGENEALMWIASFLEEHRHRKTFLINVICIAIRCLKKIILPCVTTGLAALNYDEGHTAHSLFCIPIEDNDEGYKCQISLDNNHAKLIQKSLVIIKNKLPIAQKGNIEAVDIFLRKLCNNDLPFGRKIFIEIGDFHQVTPVILHSGRTAIILETIKILSTNRQNRRYVDGEDALLALLKIIYEINNVIDFAFPETVLNDLNKCQKCAILCLLNSEVESIN
ncbi:9057_t:CDS:2, partial [Cetraspora pellucida]